MLEKIISKAHRILSDAQQRLSADSVAAIEQVYNDIIALKDFIDKELYALECNSSLDANIKKSARRGVFEQAGRKLEVIKAHRKYSELAVTQPVMFSDKPVDVVYENSLLQFLREKEVRDRLFGMTEAQILALFGDSLFDGTNPLLLRAILNSPAGFEPVSRETIKKNQQTGAGELSLEIADESETQPNLKLIVEEMFSLVKKELDNLRRSELPTQLSQFKDSKEPPFKF
jgi:hypothetical protein